MKDLNEYQPNYDYQLKYKSNNLRGVTLANYNDRILFYNLSFLDKLEKSCMKKYGYFKELDLIRERIRLLHKIHLFSPEIPSNIQSSMTLTECSLSNVKKYICENIQPSIAEISFVIITKNEQKVISRCISSIIDVADEVIILDTGSTDNTMNEIKKFNDEKIKVYQEEWQNDFSIARNSAIDKATKDWIFMIDSDEYLLPEEDLKKIIGMFNQFPNIESAAICPTIINENEHKLIGVKRIFKNKVGLKFEGAIHEYLVNSQGDYNLQSMSANIELGHDGYHEQTMNEKDKINRNLNLLKKMMKEEPDNPKWYYFLARDGFDVLNPEEIEKYIQKALTLYSKGNFNEDQDFTDSLMDMAMTLKFKQGDFQKLYEYATKVSERDPDNSNAKFYMNLCKLYDLKSQIRGLLKDTIDYREQNSHPQYGMLHSEGYHIDLLIGILLFESDMYDQAKVYFDFLKGKFDKHTLYQIYSSKTNSLMNTDLSRIGSVDR